MADALGTIECTIENCLTDRDGSLVMSLRVKSGEKAVGRANSRQSVFGAENGK